MNYPVRTRNKNLSEGMGNMYNNIYKEKNIPELLITFFLITWSIFQVDKQI